MNIAIIGYGYWGPNLVRNFSLVNNCKVKIITYVNKDGLKKKLNPINSPSYTDIMKTESLKKAIDQYKFDFIAWQWVEITTS